MPETPTDSAAPGPLGAEETTPSPAPEKAKKKRKRPRAVRIMLAVLFGVGVKKKPAKAPAASKPAAVAPAGDEVAEAAEPKSAEGSKKPRKPKKQKPPKAAKTPEQIARAERIGRRIGIAFWAIVLTAGIGGGGGWYLWNHWVTVPDLAGLSRDDATATLEGLGLEVGVVSQTYIGEEGEFATGTVVAHVPGLSARVAPHTPVAITVVAGPSTSTMPDLRGMTLRDAADRLRALEVTVVVVDPALHISQLESYPHGLDLKVGAMSVPSGGRIERRGTVGLAVIRQISGTERRYVFGHSAELAPGEAETCVETCHRQRECSQCHLAVLGGTDLPKGVTAADLIRDRTMGSAGLANDEGEPRYVRVDHKGGTAYRVLLNADAAGGAPRRTMMLEATTAIFKGVLGHAAVTDLTVTWVKPGTSRVVMEARMTGQTIWENKWSGLPPEQLPALADSFRE